MGARSQNLIMSPLYRGGDILLYFSPLICSSDQFCVCVFSPSPSIEVEIILLLLLTLLFLRSVLCLWVLSVYHAGGQIRDVDHISGYCLTTVYEADPTLAQYWVSVSCLTPRWMWASVTDGGTTLTQPWLQVVVIVSPEPSPDILAP